MSRVRLCYCIRNEPGIIPHIYASEKQNPAMYAADGRGLQAVTVAWLSRNKAAQEEAFYFMRRDGFNNFIPIEYLKPDPVAPTYWVKLKGWPERALAPSVPVYVKLSFVQEAI